MEMSDEELGALDQNVSSKIRKDSKISKYIITIGKKDLLFYQQTVKQFVSIIQKVARLYRQKISSGELDADIVRLLERNVPEDMLPYVRKRHPFLNFSRLDFQGRYIVEYNLGSAFFILTSVVERSMSELGIGERRGLLPSAQRSDEGGTLLWERVFAPLVGSAKHRSIAILDRIGSNYSTNIFGDLEALARFISSNSDVKVVFPCSDKELAYENGVLVHKKSGVRIGAVHIAASEGPNFERWKALAGGPIFEAYMEGNVELWPPLANSIMTSKFILAYLSDARWDETLQISQGERVFLNEVLPWARILTPSEAQTAKWMIRNGLKVAVKIGHGSGGREVYILDKYTNGYANILNRLAKKGNYMCMNYAPADEVKGGLVSTMDALVFIRTPEEIVSPKNIMLFSRVYKGEKANMAGEGAGISPVMVPKE